MGLYLFLKTWAIMEAKIISLEELKKHKVEGNGWLVIKGKVYDVSEFAEEHPGGEELILERLGTDATKACKIQSFNSHYDFYIVVSYLFVKRVRLKKSTYI